ncbi:MAG: hypothetical protein HOM14_04715 [Gammaproteobacteria bacterium]|jgi:hypothetical protein|nr:hypothetical protein [Gammaproteobacteria bacterium]MBT3723109.1 hypothetical protein [Gammaproteobacteria bacterium]MBT4075789.1 hypothetical protein [Gammaproteobacteria bacterium]MBT4192748.1 hypothetical protein [Gammaproteobacteria bacterium]MBT4448440.1 hypothetical protein [Gammaproteobacteria bacterium]
MKKLFKYLGITIVLIIILIIILATVAHFKKQQSLQRNKSFWNSSQPETSSKIIAINDSNKFKLSSQNNNLVLFSINSSETFVLFPNYKNNFESIKFFVKDINQIGPREIIAVASHEYSSDLYIFYYQDKSDFGKHILREVIWVGDSLLFEQDESLYIQSCGSQYCNDTYYSWNGNKLISLGTDTYESW